MHALIIEDDALIGLAIQDVLKDNGCDSFDFATCFEGAIAAASDRRPDLITADVQLDPGSGIDAVPTICAAEAIPVIFITGTGSEVRERCPDQFVLDKPFTTLGIAAAVRAVMPTR